MNSTKYTTEQLRSIIIPSLELIYSDDVIFVSPYPSQPLVEFSYNDKIIIDEASGTDLITIDFYQELMYSCGPECCGGYRENYTIIITKEKINELLNI